MNVTALQLYEKEEENMAGMIREGMNVDKWQVCGKMAGCGYLAGAWKRGGCGYLADP